MPKLFQCFLFTKFVILTILVNTANFTNAYMTGDYSKRIETVNQIARMVDLVETTRESPQPHNIIWFLLSVYVAIGSCFCLGCFAFIIKQYNDYKVYIKEVNYMHNRP